MERLRMDVPIQQHDLVFSVGMRAGSLSEHTHFWEQNAFWPSLIEMFPG